MFPIGKFAKREITGELKAPFTTRRYFSKILGNIVEYEKRNKMRYNPEKHHRHSIRDKRVDYSQRGLYFVTICTQNRECFFGEIIDKKMILNQNGHIAHQTWYELLSQFHNIKLMSFTIMPNHIHGIILIKHQIGMYPEDNLLPANTLTNKFSKEEPIHNQGWILMKNSSLSLGKIVRFYKASVTKKIREGCSIHFQWQRNYYEEIIRSKEEFIQKYNYIINNPGNWTNDDENPANIQVASPRRGS